MAARGDWKLGVNGCRVTLWSEKRLVASSTATPQSGVRSGAERIPVSGHLHGQHTLCSSTTIWHADFKVYSCTAVTTVASRATL